MTGLPAAVTQLIAAGRIERVPRDLATARLRLHRAEEKLAVANTLATIDIEVAYVTAYDAARVALTAHMLAAGLRVPARPRAHETVGIYGEAAISTSGVRSSSGCAAAGTRPNTTTSSSGSLTSSMPPTS